MRLRGFRKTVFLFVFIILSSIAFALTDCSSSCTATANYIECTGTLNCDYLNTGNNIWIHDANISGQGSPGLVKIISTGWVKIENSQIDAYGVDGSYNPSVVCPGNGELVIAANNVTIVNSILDSKGGSMGSSGANTPQCTGGNGKLNITGATVLIDSSTIHNNGGTGCSTSGNNMNGLSGGTSTFELGANSSLKIKNTK